MDELEKNERLGDLFAYYGPLLTKGQQEYFEDYYFNNFSLGEISDNEDVSRNAVHKSIKKVESELHNYEEKLGLYKKAEELDVIANEIKDEDLKERIKNIL